MSKIYVGQSKLRLILDTKVDITKTTSVKIKYIKPNSVQGEFPATVLPTLSGKSTRLYYDFQEGDLDVAGVWTFWAYVVWEDLRTTAGEVTKIRVWSEGT